MTRLQVNYDKLNTNQRRLIRLEYEQLQNRKCWYCNADLQGPPSTQILNKSVNRKLFPEGFFSTPVHLHHDHYTGMTIGAVHSYCNAVLWQYYGK